MTTAKTKPAALLAAAEKVTTEAGAAVTAAAEQIEAAARAVADAEAAVVEVLANPREQDALDQARAAVEKARRDREWSVLQHAAAEVAYYRASDAEVEARRGVTAEEYIKAHKEFNNPESRESILLQRVRADVAELIPLIAARQEHHDQLARDVASWPVEERQRIQAPGRQIVTHPGRGLGTWTVQVPNLDLSEALTAALADAAEQARAAAQAALA